MKTHADYILAKYIPELYRNEPRNIGVFVRTEFGVFARFVGEGLNGVDGRKIPAWVKSSDAYREWIGGWRSIIGDKKAADKTDILDTLTETGGGNYLLGDRASIADTISKEDCPALLDFLFSTLVEPESDKVSAKATYDLQKACNRIIKKTQAKKNPEFHENKSLACRIDDTVFESFKFDYYIGNGVPHRLYQRVPLGQAGFEKGMHAAMWQFNKVTAANLISKSFCTALVMTPEDDNPSDDLKRALDVLRTQANVLDVRTQENVLEHEFKVA